MRLNESFIKLNKSTRLYGLETPLVGLTGGLASGKSTLLKALKDKGLGIISADELVHQIYTSKEAIKFVQKHFPDVFKNGKINFPLLREKAFSTPQVIKQLEDFLYPRIPSFFHKAIQEQPQIQTWIYDVPLLFEKQLQDKFDVVACVYCTPEQQIDRLLRRDSMDEELAKKMLAKQIHIDEKKTRSDIVIDNTGPISAAKDKAQAFISHYFTE